MFLTKFNKLFSGPYSTYSTNVMKIHKNSFLLTSSPNYVVLSDTVDTFKFRLDKFRQHQDVIYDFKAEIRVTGSRSCY